MSSAKVDMVLANSRAFSNRDVEAMLALHGADAAVLDKRPVGWGDYHGHDAIRSYYEGLFDNTDGLQEDLEVVAEEGDVVIGACHVRARLAGGQEGDVVEFDYALRVTFADGLIASVEIFESAEVAAGAG